jgi:hypothetical protein
MAMILRRIGGQVFAEMNASRAAIAGRRTYEHADRWRGDHRDGVPVFVRGRRLFDQLPEELTELELTRVLDASDADPAHRVLHLRYRVQRAVATHSTRATW